MKHLRNLAAFAVGISLLVGLAACTNAPAAGSNPVAGGPAVPDSAGAPGGAPPADIALGRPSVGITIGAEPATGSGAAVGAYPMVDSGFAAGAYPISVGTSYATGQTGIWVTGTGAVTVMPDLAVLSIGVEARAGTVEGARGQAAEAMDAIVRSLRAGGVEERDIQTSYFSISPQYTWRERVDQSGGRYSEQLLMGYQVTNQATVRVRDLGKVGGLIDGVVLAGGDLARLQGISFTVADPTPLHARARELAVKEALAKAAQFAELTGVVLGKPVFITETSASPAPRAMVAADAYTMEAKVATPISAGEMAVQVSVQAAFAIQ